MGDALLWVLATLSLAQMGLILLLVVRRKDTATLTAAELDGRLSRVESLLRDEAERSRREQSNAAADARTELTRSIKELGDLLGSRIRDGSDAQGKANEAFAATLSKALTDSSDKVETLRKGVEEKLEAFRETTLQNFLNFGREQQARFNEADARDNTQAASLRGELLKLNDSLSTTLLQRVSQLNTDMSAAWGAFREELTKLSLAQQTAMESLRNSVTQNLGEIRADNEKRLEEMRKTVDEKLQSTLDQRLGESFKLVSERLESVQKGLGEMQSLASGVGDLKRVLTNVKTRGTWGEVLLSNLLEQVLTPDQYAANVSTTGTLDRVEYAIKLPGRKEDGSGSIWLPIDSKFPKEDYERLILAQEAGDTEAAAEAGKALETSIRRFAQDICSKYIESPKTTDFAIMFLPSEGLYAEVIRRTETIEWLQLNCRVMVTGPTTLGAMLNSLQMGFRTLAIQKRSSEVWDLLGAVKTEFGKYADIMAKVKRQLDAASNSIHETEKRTRVINRKLKAVEQMSDDAAAKVFPQNLLEDELTEAES